MAIDLFLLQSNCPIRFFHDLCRSGSMELGRRRRGPGFQEVELVFSRRKIMMFIIRRRSLNIILRIATFCAPLDCQLRVVFCRCTRSPSYMDMHGPPSSVIPYSDQLCRKFQDLSCEGHFLRSRILGCENCLHIFSQPTLSFYISRAWYGLGFMTSQLSGTSRHCCLT